jgi:hypothetical protein
VATDSVFCQKLLEAEIPLHVHMDVQLNHRHVTPWNRHYLYNAEARAMLSTGKMDTTSKLYQILSEQFGERGEKDILQLKGVSIIE